MAKNLLTESEFRKFMKLARLEPLSSNKLSEMYGSGRPGIRDAKPDSENEEDKELEEELSALFEEEDEAMDLGMEAGGEEDEDMPPVEDEEMPDVELDDEEGMGDDEGMEGGADNSEIESALTNLLDLIDQKLEAAGAGEMMDVETEDEPEGGEGDMGGIEGGDTNNMDAAPPAPEDDMASLEETVLRRVARRLQRESKIDRQSTVIAERVMKRLMKR